METKDIIKLALEHDLRLHDDIKLNEMGADFLVAFASDMSGRNWVLRIPRRAALAGQIEQEKNILAFVKDRISVAVPDWQIASPTLVAYPMLEDKPVLTYDPVTYEVTWNINQAENNYTPSLAKTLAGLHGISLQEAQAAGITISTSEMIRQDILDKIQQVKYVLPINPKLETRWRKWLDNDRLWPDFTGFIHGDLFAGHILSKPDGNITGIIDWSEGQVGDIAADFAGHLTVFGQESLKELLSLYVKAGGKVWDNLADQIAERQAATPLFYASFAIDSQSPQHLEAAKEQLT